MIPMGTPLLPPAEKLLPYLKKIDENRWYSNAGPLVREYEERIGNHFNCYAAATSSGTAGLTAALIAQDMKGEIFMPAWSFVATANAVVLAGCSPYFIDVDEETWTPESTDLAVAPFGKPVDYDGAILIDAAAAFDAYYLGQVKIDETPVAISTHCTKTFSTGEGGLVLSTDKTFIDQVKDCVNHGMTLDREVHLPGFNGKMSEYHAAIGLAELDNWAWKRRKWLDAKRRYIESFGELAHTTPLSSLSFVGSTFCIRLMGRNALGVRHYLEDKGIMSRKIWGDGIHRYEAFSGCPRDALPVTERLAKEVVFVPFSIDTSDANLDKIVSTVQEALQCV